MPIATEHRPAIARTPKSPTFLPYSTVPVPQPPAVSLNLNLGLYEELYCARGDMENRIKEQQLWLFADRTSAATMRANQLRLTSQLFPASS